MTNSIMETLSQLPSPPLSPSYHYNNIDNELKTLEIKLLIRKQKILFFFVSMKWKRFFEDFWVHPMYLSLQSYQFFKLFEEVKNNNEQGIIEIEVPSLKTFAFILYWIYTGDKTKLFDIAKLDELFCKGIMENIQYLDVEIN
eukprot:jgi/Orpsp1_1/1176585/evm.model.c7180000058196.1